MLLSKLQVENYKGIRSATVNFDETTAMIGENETGKGTLFEVLTKVLDPFDDFKEFVFSQDCFHLIGGAPAGRIAIALTFSEMEEGEWDNISNPEFWSFIKDSKDRLRSFRLSIRSTTISKGETGTIWQVLDSRGKAASGNLNTSMVTWIRQYKRVIHLQAGILTGMMSPDEVDFHRLSYSEYLNVNDEVVRDILHYSYKILTDTSSDHIGDIRKGFQASVSFINRFNERDDVRRKMFGLKIETILGKEGHRRDLDNYMNLELRRDKSQQLGVLLFTSAWIKVNPELENNEVDPIVILEYPEAHLHPITMASTIELFALIWWQKLITTYSGELISEMSITSIRKLLRRNGKIIEKRVKPNTLSKADLRKVGYHLGSRNSSAWFNRVWLLVEGESESWIMPYIAQKMGYSFGIEGISCIEFSQSGLNAYIRLAEQLGISWHVLIDGDDAGKSYLSSIQRHLKGKNLQDFVTILPDKDIETHFWNNGFDYVYYRNAKVKSKEDDLSADQVIKRAVRRHSKPHLSLSIVDELLKNDSPKIPETLSRMIERMVRVARSY